MSKVAAVVVDDWKIPVFKRHLDAAGYKYDAPIRFTKKTSTIRVHYEWVHKLAPIVHAAEDECKGMKR